ncbi:glycerophosphodiester phosphodiesterase, partial [Methylobacterium frigidaeris]
MTDRLAPGWLIARPIAHRGLHDRAAGIPENTIAAAEAAIVGGYAIECDVQLSRDGEAMVFHDAGLGRLTGADGLVRER